MSSARRPVTVLLGILGLTATAFAVAAAPAAADGPTTFANSGAIAVPAGSSPDQSGPASPYPASISVSGLTGAVSEVTATLNNLSHDSAGDLDVMLVAPDGSNLVLMSDRGDPSSLTFASNATLSFSDGAAGQLPSAGLIGSGTYKPSDNDPGGAPDSFPAPAPAPSSATTFTGAFTGVDPNGTWKLYAVDDATGDTGSIAGGWSVTITTTVAAAPTTTTVSASPNPASTTDTVTLTATVTSGGSPVTAGSVAFNDNGSLLGNDALDAGGHATLDVASLSEGSHQIVASFSGTPDLLSSNGTTTEVVDTPTTVAGSTYCNPGGITVPESGISIPYASHITVSGAHDVLTAVTAELHGVDHSVPADLDVLLVGPSGQAVTLLSDAGGTAAVTGVDLTFDDGAPAVSSTSLTTGTYSPTDDDTDGADTFPAPAPAPTGSAMSDFEAGSANGTWSLYVVDDASGDAGSIDSWCVNVTTKQSTSTSFTVVPDHSDAGDQEVLTATVSGGGPVITGRVAFYDNAGGTSTLIGLVKVNELSQAVLTTSSLPPGKRLLRARYRTNPTYVGSTSPQVAVKVKPVAEANGPYTVVRNNSLSLSAAGSSVNGGSNIGWDLNGDGVYTDASGLSPTLTWIELQALGLQAGQSYRIVVRVTTGGLTDFDRATLHVLRN